MPRGRARHPGTEYSRRSRRVGPRRPRRRAVRRTRAGIV